MFSITKNDRRAKILIFSFSVIVFIAITVLDRVKLTVETGFDEHIFAKINAVINSVVAVLLVAGYITARGGRFTTHKYIMLTAIGLSFLFLVSYISHHLLAGSTFYGDLDHNGLVSDAEKAAAGNMRYMYFILLGTHILLAGIVLPFILFTAYRALINENEKHRKLAKIAWPIWLYVAITGPIVYWLIRPYY